MKILNVRSVLSNYSLDSMKGLNKGKSATNSLKNVQNDRVEISNTSNKMTGMIDKGTAANTTLYVDHSTLRQIVNYTTNNPECRWSELGVDGEKRWVVVNGQRFECPLSEEEKKAYRKSQENTFFSYLEESRLKRDENISGKNGDRVEIDFSNDSFGEYYNKNLKIDNLLKNEQVMSMLNDISKKKGGKLSLSII